MIVAVADSHAFHWYIFGDSRISANAKTFIDTADQNGNQIGVS
jgi:PIN domain nuclease of toxin-antitoxin system